MREKKELILSEERARRLWERAAQLQSEASQKKEAAEGDPDSDEPRRELIAGVEDENLLAEAAYETGICYYGMNSYDKAFIALRKVTNEYNAFAIDTFTFFKASLQSVYIQQRLSRMLILAGTCVDDWDRAF